MFKEIKSLLKARNKSLINAENKIQELTKENRELKQIRLQEVRNSTKILKQSNKKTELINRITDLANGNKCNNEKAVLNTIKELVNDYQSQN